MEKFKNFFWMSLFIMSVCNLIISCMNIFDFELPDFLLFILLLVELCSVIFLVYFSVKLWLGNTDNKK